MEPIPAEPLPLPQAPQPEPQRDDGPLPGQLTFHWATLFWAGWLLVIGALVAVWYSARITGLSTWWLGPRAEPRLILVNLFPFSVPVALCLGGLSGLRRLPWYGIGGSLFVAGIAVFDIHRVPGYAAIEFLIAGAGLLISLASFAGMYRKGPTADATPVTADATPDPTAAATEPTAVTPDPAADPTGGDTEPGAPTPVDPAAETPAITP